MSLARRIESYIKALMKDKESIEIRRSELAETFRCVPSQINYVMSTRFTPSHGYLVESHRGGGGYLKIIKLTWGNSMDEEMQEICLGVRQKVNEVQAECFLCRLNEEQIITEREYYLLKALVGNEVLVIGLKDPDFLRSRLMQAALIALSRNDLEKEE